MIQKPTNLWKLVFLFFTIVFSCYTSHSQTKIDTLVAWQHYNKGYEFLEKFEHDESIIYFEKAKELYQKAKHWRKVTACYNRISENYLLTRRKKEALLNIGKAQEFCQTYLNGNNEERATIFDNKGEYYLQNLEYDKALEHFKDALEIRSKIKQEGHSDFAISYTNLGLTYRHKGRYKKALLYFEKALKNQLDNYGENHFELTKFYNNVSSLYYTKGSYKIALDYINKSIKITSDKFGKNHIKVAPYYNNSGALYKKIGQLNKAIKYYQRTLVIAQKYLGDSHPKIALCYSNLGLCYALKKDYTKSITYQQKSLEIRKKVFGNQNPNVAISYSALGDVCFMQHKYENALSYYKKSLEIRLKVKGNMHPETANDILKIGIVYEAQQNYKDALEKYEKVLAIQTEVLESKHPFTAKTLNYVANVFTHLEKYEKADSIYIKSLETNSVIQEKKGIENKQKTVFLDPQIALESKNGLAKNYFLKFKRTNTFDDILKSVRLYKQVDTLIDLYRRDFSNYEDKVEFSKKIQETYSDAIMALLALNEKKPNHKILEQSFIYAEKSKTNILTTTLLDSDAKLFSGVSPYILAVEKELKTDYAYYKSKIADSKKIKKQNTEEIINFEKELFDIKLKQDSLIKAIEKNYPRYYRLKHENNLISIKEIQEKLNKKTTVLEYFTLDNITYVFLITKNKFVVKELSTPKLEEKIRALRASVTTKNTKAYKKKAYHLYQDLVAPVKDDFVGDELIIVPDGALWHLNFDVLLTKDVVSENPGELFYLLKDYAVSYANSANLLFNPFTQKEQKEQRQGCLAFSFSDSSKTVKSNNISLATLRAAGDDLPGTRKEIKAIADIVDGQYYFGADADEASFKKNANKYKILHLALHGEVDNDRPENSKLYFTKSSDTIEDGFLYGHELFALDIPAELTVLSACNTGGGKIAKGEGIMSLGNAFQYAGAKSLLLSSWEVPDKTTPQLMQYFYQNIKDGKSKSKALQQAKLQYLKTADIYNNAPFYWGGFYLVGNTAPIDFGTGNLWYWILGLMLLGIITVFTVRKRKRKKGNH